MPALLVLHHIIFFPPFAVFPHRTRQSPCRALAKGGELTQSVHETSSVDFFGGTLDPLRVTVLLCVYTCTVDISVPDDLT